MRVRVNFRVNSATGEVEEFLIEDISTEAEPDHDAAHDRIALQVGKVVERRPAPRHVVGPAAGDTPPPFTYQPGDELPPIPEKETDTE